MEELRPPLQSHHKKKALAVRFGCLLLLNPTGNGL